MTINVTQPKVHAGKLQCAGAALALAQLAKSNPRGGQILLCALFSKFEAAMRKAGFEKLGLPPDEDAQARLAFGVLCGYFAFQGDLQRARDATRGMFLKDHKDLPPVVADALIDSDAREWLEMIEKVERDVASRASGQAETAEDSPDESPEEQPSAQEEAAS